MRRAEFDATNAACSFANVVAIAKPQAAIRTTSPFVAMMFALVATSLCAAEPAERQLDDTDREHWAFRPLVRPALPADITTANPIDAFILAKLRKESLQPLGEVDRHTLLRRVTFDLAGLPPTPSDIAAFLADTSPGAWERVVDRLLASPTYGERWAQHWLDLARFAETDGFEHDLPRPQAWRYRDWVIAALNADLPFDQFVRLQIAGDLLAPDDPAAVIATGFLLCGPDMPDINNQDERRHTVMNEMAATVGEVFLGLQIGCAQCHDHKVDPISQFDFYRLRAFFDAGDIFQEHAVATPEERAVFKAAMADRGEHAGPIEAELKELDSTAKKRLREQNPDLLANADNLRSVMTAEELSRQKELKQLLSKLPPAPELPRGRVFKQGAVKKSHLYARGDFRRPAAEVEPAFVRIAAPVSRSLGSDRETSAPTRVDLADWLVSPDNPLTLRVFANRVWQFHFGQGLVPTSSDFGFGGADPTHPELLDWLATELPRNGGRLKALHRLIVTSETYRRASRPAKSEVARFESLVAADPDNRLWGRRSMVRLEGEAIRDAMLAAADRLSDRRGGPGVRPPLPAELVGTLLKNQWNVSPDEEDHRRRSIYLFVRRNLRYPLFEVFDRPDTNQSCAVRARSTVAPQSLALMNAELSDGLARDLAALVRQQHPSNPAQQIAVAFTRCLGRPPTDAERSRAAAYLDRAAASRDALAGLCLALFNLNEFVYVD
jgi:hypothetical protein